jgi:hypothetical protein
MTGTVSIFRVIDAGSRLLRNFRTHLPKSCNTPVSIFNLCCSLGAQTKFETKHALCTYKRNVTEEWVVLLLLIWDVPGPY